MECTAFCTAGRLLQLSKLHMAARVRSGTNPEVTKCKVHDEEACMNTILIVHTYVENGASLMLTRCMTEGPNPKPLPKDAET